LEAYLLRPALLELVPAWRTENGLRIRNQESEEQQDREEPTPGNAPELPVIGTPAVQESGENPRPTCHQFRERPGTEFIQPDWFVKNLRVVRCK
jgi:hypothetical protein